MGGGKSIEGKPNHFISSNTAPFLDPACMAPRE